MGKILYLKNYESQNQIEIEREIMEVRSKWVDIYAELRDNKDVIEALSEMEFQKFVLLLQTLICELPELDSTQESNLFQ